MTPTIYRAFIHIFSFTIILAVTLLPIIVWASYYDWQVTGRTTHELFPLFGMLAFSLMWLQVVIPRIFQSLDKTFLKAFSLLAGLGIFIAVLLHPLLLAWAEFIETEKLPPESWYKFVSGKYRDYITVGIIAWITFLAYDILRAVKKTNFYKRYSWIIRYSGHTAFFLIFFHGLYLGTHLDEGFFRYVWYFYGISAFILITIETVNDISKLKSARK